MVFQWFVLCFQVVLIAGYQGKKGRGLRCLDVLFGGNRLSEENDFLIFSSEVALNLRCSKRISFGGFLVFLVGYLLFGGFRSFS